MQTAFAGGTMTPCEELAYGGLGPARSAVPAPKENAGRRAERRHAVRKARVTNGLDALNGAPSPSLF